MPLEIEAKLIVPDHEPIRAQLRHLGATLIGQYFETNTLFDTPARDLYRSNRGLRLRTRRDTHTGRIRHILTHKGPQQPGPFKSREETELIVDSADACTDLLRHLGFQPSLVFQKRRESWRLDNCQVDFDELPRLGRFIEIEGPDERAVAAIRQQLNLHSTQLISKTYIALLIEHARAAGEHDTLEFRFPEQ